MVIYESVFFLSRESGLSGDYGKGSDKKGPFTARASGDEFCPKISISNRIVIWGGGRC